MSGVKQSVASFIEVLIGRELVSVKEGLILNQRFLDVSLAAFTHFLLEETLVDRQDLFEALSYYYKVPAFDTVGFFFDHDLLHMFPKSFLLRSALIPLECDDDLLIVVAADPSNPEHLLNIGKYVSYEISFRVGLINDICDAVKEYYDPSLTQESEEMDAFDAIKLKEDTDIFDD